MPMLIVEKVFEAERLTPCPPLTIPNKCNANWPEKLPEMAARSVPPVTTEPVAAMVTLVELTEFNTKALAVAAARSPYDTSVAVAFSTTADPTGAMIDPRAVTNPNSPANKL